MTFLHPFKAAVTTPVQSTTGLLVWTPSNAGSNEFTDGYFQGENFRIVDTSYASQASVLDSDNEWDSEASMNDVANYPEHSTGLLIYDGYLMAPKYGGANGNFKNHDEGGSIESPLGNVDYSNLVNSNRTYLRYFRNNTANDRPSILITLYGDAYLAAKTGNNYQPLGQNKNINVHICVPGRTGFVDLARPFEGTGNYFDDNGSLVGDLVPTITTSGVTHRCSFSGQFALAANQSKGVGADRIVVRITAHKDWTGYLSRIKIEWA
jgi:hypothetical protein